MPSNAQMPLTRTVSLPSFSPLSAVDTCIPIQVGRFQWRITKYENFIRVSTIMQH